MIYKSISIAIDLSFGWLWRSLLVICGTQFNLNDCFSLSWLPIWNSFLDSCGTHHYQLVEHNNFIMLCFIVELILNCMYKLFVELVFGRNSGRIIDCLWYSYLVSCIDFLCMWNSIFRKYFVCGIHFQLLVELIIDWTLGLVLSIRRDPY